MNEGKKNKSYFPKNIPRNTQNIFFIVILTKFKKLFTKDYTDSASLRIIIFYLFDRIHFTKLAIKLKKVFSQNNKFSTKLVSTAKKKI